MKKLRGFTITEVLIMVVILATIITIVIINYGGYQKHSQTKQNRIHANEVMQKMDVWATNYKEYPNKLGQVNDAQSLIVTFSSDTRQRVLDGLANGPGPSFAKNIRIDFCHRPDDDTLTIGARIYYWNLNDRKLEFINFANASEASAICQTATGN